MYSKLQNIREKYSKKPDEQNFLTNFNSQYKKRQ